MRVSELMTSEVLSVDAASTVLDAARTMAEREVGCVLVRRNDALVGMLTDRDIVVRGVAEGLNLEIIPVQKLMTPDVRTCTGDVPLWEVEQLMELHALRRLVVVSETGKVEGIISADDLATVPPEHLIAPVPMLSGGAR